MNDGYYALDAWSLNFSCRMLQALKGNLQKLREQAAFISEQIRKMQSIATSEAERAGAAGAELMEVSGELLDCRRYLMREAFSAITVVGVPVIAPGVN